MKEKIKQERGVTLFALVVMIMVLAIIAGIALYSGKEVINNANLESMRTNMMLIEAKAREYIEDADFKMGTSPDDAKKESVRQEVYVNDAKLKRAYGDDGNAKISELSNVTMPSEVDTLSAADKKKIYYVTPEAMQQWGLNDIKIDNGVAYLISLDDDTDNLKVEVYNTLGFQGNYSLTELNALDM